MTSLPKVALVGATGNLGSVILSKLLAAKFLVTILTRQGSTSSSKLPPHPNQTIKEADYASRESLVAALQGTDVVISTVSTGKTGDQDDLINAALATGTVTRFIPSEFGSDIWHPANANLPIFDGKRATVKYLGKLTAEHPHFTYTTIMNNPFLDWGISYGLLVNPHNHTATLWNGGDVPFSTTTLSTVADTVIAVLHDLPGTANQHVRVHDTVVTQNQLIAMIKKIDGVEWTTTVSSTEDCEDQARKDLQAGETAKGMVAYLMVAIFGPGRDVFASQVDNKRLGIKEMSRDEVEEVVRKVVKG